MLPETLTRSHLVDSIHSRLGFSRAEASELVDAVFTEINETLSHEHEVKISLFGTFKVRQKQPRLGRNPKTMQEVMISARNVVSFIASNKLKARINRNNG